MWPAHTAESRPGPALEYRGPRSKSVDRISDLEDAWEADLDYALETRLVVVSHDGGVSISRQKPRINVSRRGRIRTKMEHEYDESAHS